MNCPYCGHEKTTVVTIRHDHPMLVRRYRKCEACGRRFSTWEEIDMEAVEKQKAPGPTWTGVVKRKI